MIEDEDKDTLEDTIDSSSYAALTNAVLTACNSSASNSNSITINGGNSSIFSSGTWDYAYANEIESKCSTTKLIELHLVDGTKILKLLKFKDLIDVREIKTEGGGEAVAFELVERGGDLKTYTVDCDLAAFANLFGIEYEHFASAVLKSAVDNG